jgi:hypothetical protein
MPPFPIIIFILDRLKMGIRPPGMPIISGREDHLRAEILGGL